MNAFGIPYRILCEDATAPNHVYAGSCRLIGIYCASVGLTGLPADPPPPAVIAAIAPVSGPDNVPITITGSGFGNEIGECKIGGEFVIVQTWADGVITALASQGDKPSSVPLALTVTPAGGEPTEFPNAFTFTAAVAVPDPVVTSVTPSEGANGTEVTVAGSNFGAAQGGGTVGFGYDAATIVSWSDTSVVCNAVQAMSGSDIPQPVTLVRDDGKQSDGSVAFIFTDPVADTASAKGRKAAAKKKRKSVTNVEVEAHGTDVVMPEFASGAGIMLRDSSGKRILVGPFELLAKTMYELPVICADGIEVVPSGVFDITLLLAPPV